MDKPATVGTASLGRERGRGAQAGDKELIACSRADTSRPLHCHVSPAARAVCCGAERKLQGSSPASSPPPPPAAPVSYLQASLGSGSGATGVSASAHWLLNIKKQQKAAESNASLPAQQRQLSSASSAAPAQQRQLSALTGRHAPPLDTSLPCPQSQSSPSHACRQCMAQQLQWTRCLQGRKPSRSPDQRCREQAPTRRPRPARPCCPARCCSQCWPPPQARWPGLCSRMC